MRLRLYYFLLFIVHLIIIIAVPILCLINGINENLEIVLLLVFLLGYFVLIYRARKYFILHKSTDDDAMFMAPEKSASKQEQLSHYSMEIRIRYIGYILLSFMIFGYAHYQSELNEYFSIYHVDISLSYLGYWMTILMLPILGILDYFWLLNKVKHLTP